MSYCCSFAFLFIFLSLQSLFSFEALAGGSDDEQEQQAGQPAPITPALTTPAAALPVPTEPIPNISATEGAPLACAADHPPFAAQQQDNATALARDPQLLLGLPIEIFIMVMRFAFEDPNKPECWHKDWMQLRTVCKQLNRLLTNDKHIWRHAKVSLRSLQQVTDFMVPDPILGGRRPLDVPWTHITLDVTVLTNLLQPGQQALHGALAAAIEETPQRFHHPDNLLLGEQDTLTGLTFSPAFDPSTIYIYRCHTLEGLYQLHHLTHLRILKLDECAKVEALDLSGLHNLVSLGLRGCFSLTHLNVANLHNLTGLLLNFCENLLTLSGLYDLAELRIVKIQHCHALKHLACKRLFKLEKATIDFCKALETTTWDTLPQMKTLIIKSTESLHTVEVNALDPLETMILSGCGKPLNIRPFAQLPHLLNARIQFCPAIPQADIDHLQSVLQARRHAQQSAAAAENA